MLRSLFIFTRPSLSKAGSSFNPTKPLSTQRHRQPLVSLKNPFECVHVPGDTARCKACWGWLSCASTDSCRGNPCLKAVASRSFSSWHRHLAALHKSEHSDEKLDQHSQVYALKRTQSIVFRRRCTAVDCNAYNIEASVSWLWKEMQ
jgi:hypothetical protein